MASAIKGSVTAALDPKYSKKQITVEKVDLSPIGKSEARKIAFLLRNVFTPLECVKLIQLSENYGYETAMINLSDGVAVHAPGYRDGHRVMIDDSEFAKILFKRISKFLPQVLNYGDKLLEINERLRFLRYGPNDKFMPHEDGSYDRGDAETYITLQMYLNQGFNGGETTFLETSYGTGKRIPIVPETGMILVFQHDILHEGSVVKSGTKYTIRGDVLYSYQEQDEPSSNSIADKVKNLFTGK